MYKDVSAIELGASVIRAAMQKAGLKPQLSQEMQANASDKLKNQGLVDVEKAAGPWPEDARPVTVDEVIMGNVLTAGLGQNPGRQSMIKAGITKETPAFTINKVCSSGLKAIALGAQSIMTGQAEVVIAGGQENMTRVPLALLKARWGHRMELTGIGDIHDLMVFDGLYEIFYGYHMGFTAENIASLYNISRQEQDELSVMSHQRALTAIRDGLFKEEIVPITVSTRKGDIIIDTDERPMETDMQKMAKLRPAFSKDGTVTAGNASGINDGAGAVVLMSAEKAAAMGLQPKLKIKSFASGGLDPAYMGLGPVPAIRKALKMADMTLDDIEMIELNEAFASQAIGCMKELGIAYEKPNEVGSGISLGHPIGATGARQMVTGMHLMQRKGYRTGLISMCIGGGMGMAMIVESAA